MKSKKAFLYGEYTINILIAVLCILILIGVGVKFYNNFKEREIQVAQENLNEIFELINGLQENQPREYVMLTSEGWVLSGWPSKLLTINADLSPDICLSNKWKNCVCICKTDEVEEMQDVLLACNTNNLCKEIKYAQFIVNPASSDVNVPISIQKDLIDDKKSLNIHLEGKDKLVITTK